MKIRKATKKDLEGIYEVMRKVGYINYVYKTKTKTQVLKGLSEKFKKRTHIVAIKHDKIIGYSIFTSFMDRFKKECPEIKRKGYIFSQGIGIDPKYQGNGLGKKLKKETLKLAKETGYKGMYTDVSSNNRKSLNLQLATGFKEIARFRHKKRKPKEKNVLFLREFK